MKPYETSVFFREAQCCRFAMEKRRPYVVKWDSMVEPIARHLRDRKLRVADLDEQQKKQLFDGLLLLLAVP